MANDEPANSLAGLGEFAVIDRLRRRAATSRRLSRWVRVTTPRSSSRATARRWCPPTCSSRADTSGWTGRHRMMSAERPSRRTPPTSRPWAPRQPLSSSRSAHPVTHSTAQALELADGMWQEAGRLGAGIVGGDLVSAPQWVISVTALGDLDGRAPVLRAGARGG